jgi:hypothetical protein
MASRSLIVGRFPLGEPDFRGRPGGKRGGAQAWRLAGVADPAAGAAAAARVVGPIARAEGLPLHAAAAERALERS